MYNTNLAKEVAKIAKKAGDAIMKIYDNSDNFQVQHKADESPLTIADQAANEVICHQLKNLDIKYPIISEENKSIDFEERKKYTHYWLVDPLDGTKEFIKRNGEFTVNIALIENQRPVLGVVYAPVLEEMYFAVKGEGAFLEKENITIQLHASIFSKKEIEIFLEKILRETNLEHYEKKGKNYYITNKEHNIKITINSNTFRVITVDKITH